MNTTVTAKPWLSILEAAEHIDVNHHTIRRMISRGQLKAYRAGKIIRIKPADLEKALKPVTRIYA